MVHVSARLSRDHVYRMNQPLPTADLETTVHGSEDEVMKQPIVPVAAGGPSLREPPPAPGGSRFEPGSTMMAPCPSLGVDLRMLRELYTAWLNLLVMRALGRTRPGMRYVPDNPTGKGRMVGTW